MVHRARDEAAGCAGRPPYQATIHLGVWIVANFAEFELLVLAQPGLAGLTPGRRGLSWLNQVSGRLLLNLADRHLRAGLRHSERCTEQCANGCDVLELDVWLGQPVLPSEIRAAKAAEQRMQALARGEFN